MKNYLGLHDFPNVWAITGSFPWSYFKPFSDVWGTFTSSFMQIEKYGARIMKDNKNTDN